MKPTRLGQDTQAALMAGKLLSTRINKQRDWPPKVTASLAENEVSLQINDPGESQFLRPSRP